MRTDPAAPAIAINRKIFIAMLASVLVAATAITGQSLWIDEANAAWKSVQPDFASFAAELTGAISSDTQMPGYMAGLWAWEKVFGHREWVLRAFNIPWLLLACWSLLGYWRVSQRLQFFALLCLLVSPFTWFYLDEARPYAMQIGAAMLAACATFNLLFRYDRKELSPALFCFLLSTLMLSAASLFAMLLALLFFLLLGVSLVLPSAAGRRVEVLKNRSVWVLLAVSAIPFTGLAGYYFWTLGLGAKASAVGQTGLINIPFIFYELAGFSGLGPDRNSIRESMWTAFRPYTWSLAIGILAYGAVLLGAWRGLRADERRYATPILTGLGLMVAAVVVSFLVGWLGHFRLLGRHLTPVFPVLLLCLSGGLALLWRDRTGRLCALAFFAVMLTSSLVQRFHPRYAKDDYRGAAAIARQALDSGQVVWWAADQASTQFYGVPEVHVLMNPEIEDFDHLPRPDVIILSKTDVYDASGTLRQWIVDHQLSPVKHLRAFAIHLPESRAP
jgi:uncharacterized membrane protein